MLMARQRPSARRDSPSLGLRPVGRGALHAQILRQIKQRLITGQFRPGQKLPLRALADELGTSAMPVRDALQRLASIGVLTAGPNRPMQVPELRSADLLEIREIRVALEGAAAERAARFAGGRALERLETCLSRLTAAADQGCATEFFLANWRFHLELMSAGNSPVTLSMIEPLWLRMGPALRLSKPDRRHFALAIPVHAEIVAAIRAHDLPAARAAVARDINACVDMTIAAGTPALEPPDTSSASNDRFELAEPGPSP